MSIIKIDEMIFYIFLLLIVVINTNNKIYRIPFGQHNCEYALHTSSNSSNIIENILFNIIYINISIGTPPQKIPFQLNMDSESFFVPFNYFNPNKSSTYESISKKKLSFYNLDLKNGFISKDYIYIDNIKEKIDFVYATGFKKNNNIGNIGLLIPYNINKEENSFFVSLKKAGIIDSYSFTLKFYDDISLLDMLSNCGKQGKYIGEFIIGDDPHNYETNKEIYNESEFLQVAAMEEYGGIFWDIYFNEAYIIDDHDIENKIKITGNKKAEINPNIGFIVATNEFFSLINQTFFNKYKNICEEKEINNTSYTYFECDKSDSFDVTSFPNIYLKSFAFETIFNLTYEDLFIFDETNNKYIFCILHNQFVYTWILGSIFLRKYQFVFNIDKKIIGYYKSMNFHKHIINSNYNNLKNQEFQNQNKNNKSEDTKDKSDNNDNTNNKTEYYIYIFIGLLFLICSFLFVLLGIFIQRKCLNYKRKKRANELEDEVNDLEKNDNLLK